MVVVQSILISRMMHALNVRNLISHFPLSLSLRLQALLKFIGIRPVYYVLKNKYNNFVDNALHYQDVSNFLPAQIVYTILENMYKLCLLTFIIIFVLFVSIVVGCLQYTLYTYHKYFVLFVIYCCEKNGYFLSIFFLLVFIENLLSSYRFFIRIDYYKYYFLSQAHSVYTFRYMRVPRT